MTCFEVLLELHPPHTLILRRPQVPPAYPSSRRHTRKIRIFNVSCRAAINVYESVSQILPAELSAAAVLINYWNKTVNNAAWITMCLVVAVAINVLGAGAYGEAEFIFASIKVSKPPSLQSLTPHHTLDCEN
ncbi:hypothetical protein FRC19_000984 [Serendipita sp. 401]|nr:hypothetical protein FRC19_000984 [Serendipita sp. 401]